MITSGENQLTDFVMQWLQHNGYTVTKANWKNIISRQIWNRSNL